MLPGMIRPVALLLLLRPQHAIQSWPRPSSLQSWTQQWQQQARYGLMLLLLQQQQPSETMLAPI